MTKEEIIAEILDNNIEDEVLESIDEAKYDFVDADDIEEADGDVCEAYESYGRGEAESQVLQEIMKKYDDDLKGNLDLYCEIWDTLCEEWNISTN